MSYLLNTNSKTIHLASSRNGSCRINKMREEYKMFFDTFEQAREHPTPESPLAKKCCRFCLPNKNI